MATRNILKDGDSGLSKKSRVVTDFNGRLHQLLDDMRETLIDANGLGLAAPQVGVLRRVALIVDSSEDKAENCEEINDLDESDDFYEDDDYTEEELREFLNNKIIELINPEIISINGEQTDREGCLSVPGIYGIVTRPDVVVVRAQDRFGNTFELETSKLTARAVCHEVDHLDGVLFTAKAERILTDEEVSEG